MQILVLYYSKSGNTKKLADEVVQGAREVGHDVVIRSTAEVTKEDFLDASGIIAGSPVYFGVMAAELKKVFDDFVGIRRQMEDKVGAAFSHWGASDRRERDDYVIDLAMHDDLRNDHRR